MKIISFTPNCSTPIHSPTPIDPTATLSRHNHASSSTCHATKLITAPRTEKSGRDGGYQKPGSLPIIQFDCHVAGGQQKIETDASAVHQSGKLTPFGYQKCAKVHITAQITGFLLFKSQPPGSSASFHLSSVTLQPNRPLGYFSGSRASLTAKTASY